MRRRSVLAAAAALAAGGGCLDVVGENPVEVRARRASDSAAENATACTLSASFVESHSALERVLKSATTAPDGEWIVTDVDRKTGDALAAALRERCGRGDAVYRYDGDAYRVRVEETDDNG
ncbi:MULTISPECIES: hypothetical protein [Halobacterium]|uniref:hypothetical protein n=1 Tax=Halobacterium TaxID=2239 RepID=UPI00073E9F19|nr:MULTISPECIES: hypothetical protein [Halobacterium]MCG1004295.1 hypothetical protein [Halobacterium noricense]